jgi:hypothetical protein
MTGELNVLGFELLLMEVPLFHEFGPLFCAHVGLHDPDVALCGTVAGALLNTHCTAVPNVMTVVAQTWLLLLPPLVQPTLLPVTAPSAESTNCSSVLPLFVTPT